MDTPHELRKLPAVDRVADALGADLPHPIRVAAARSAIEAARERALEVGATPDLDEVVDSARSFLQKRETMLLKPVINATGVLIHTNLGRVPLGRVQLEAVERVASAYSNLEFDLETGSRGDRYRHARDLICALTHAESALVVNNNASAVLVTLAGVCRGKEVIVSRGELIEIGGEFRIPDVMALSGARLVEVGTTNRTHLADYADAITSETGAILKVHPSNYQVVGFTATVTPRQIATLAGERGLSFIHDLGSGLIARADPPDWMHDDPPIDVALEDGADIVTFSGDKLLGGPQAGVIAGRSHLIDTIARHPLLRAVRVDKMTLAALEATLDLYLRGREGELPLWAMALAPPEQIENRARLLTDRLQGIDEGLKVEAVACSAVPGGGSAPGQTIPSWAVSISHQERSPAELSAALRAGDPPVIGRIENDRLLLDLRTVPEDRDTHLTTVVAAVLRP